MSELVILVVEDEPEVRAEVVRDLSRVGSSVRIDQASDVVDARAALSEALAAGDRVGVVVADHRLPGGESGVDLLVAVHHDPELAACRTMLLTGQAGHDDTIRAVNEAGLDHYFAKPWDADELVAAVIQQLTDYVIDTGVDPLPFVRDLDGPRLLDAYSKRTTAD